MDASKPTEQKPPEGVAAGFTNVQQMIEHVPQLVRARDVRSRIFGAGSVNDFNARIAVSATHLLSSMWFFWFCVILDLVELPSVLMNLSPIIVVTYISQTVIQLLALPLLGAGQRIIAAAQDARAEADHKTLTALHTINVNQLAILRRIDKLEEGHR